MCKAITQKGTRCKNLGTPFCKIHCSKITYIPISSFICKLVSDEKCNTSGLKISNALIKTASTRIFSEPEQSIMELPINSIDSYNAVKGIQSVGKFGMGFFSLLYWLTESYDRYIILSSKTSNENYTIVLQWFEDGLMMFEINYIPIEFNSKSGTTISLCCDDFQLTDRNIEKIKIHLHKLFNIKNYNILLNNEIINTFNNGDDIKIILNKNLIKVSDGAMGISKSILYNSLLVPSSSTKGIINEINTINNLIYEILPSTIKCSSLHILVNNISIVNIYYDDILYEDKIHLKYIINLPNNSKLPVSRDDIIYEYNSPEINELKLQLKGIVDYIIINIFNLIPLINLLNMYTKTNTSNVLNKCILEIKKYIEDKKDIIFINFSNNKILFDLNIPNLVYYDNPNMYESENKMKIHLDKIAKDDIFKLKKVIFSDRIFFGLETCGLINYIFISKSYITKFGDNWINNLILTNPVFILFPINSNVGIALEILNMNKIAENIYAKLITTKDYLYFINDNSKKLIEFYTNDKIITLLKILKTTWERKTQTLKSNSNVGDNGKLIYVEYTALNVFISIYNDVNYIEKTCEFIICLNSAIQNIKFEFAYGQDKKIFFDYRTTTLLTINENSILIDYYYELEKYRWGGNIRINGLRDFKFFIQTTSSDIIDIFMVDKYYININKKDVKKKFNKNYSILKNNVKITLEKLKISKDIINKEILYNLNIIDKVKNILNNKIIDNYNFKKSEINENLKNLLQKIKFDLSIYNITFIEKIQKVHTIREILSFNNIFFQNFNLYYVNQKLLDEMYNGLLECITIEHQYLFLYFVSKFIQKYNIKMNNVKKIGKYLAYLIKNISNIKLLVKNWVNKLNRVEFDRYIETPINEKMDKYYNYINTENNNITNIKYKYTYIFSCKTLIYYLYTNGDKLNFSKLNFLYKSNDFNFEIKLQIVEIAVNSGTTKPFIDAVITELYQNSLDAIRTFEYKNNRIDFTINTNSISIKDYVGIDNIIYILIPFLSSKNSNDVNVSGEMGTGFFNVFRQPYSKKVYIKSIYNNKLTVIECTPILKDNIVLDIEYKIYTKLKINEVNSTEILIILNENEYLIDLLVDCEVFIKTYIGIDSNIDVYLNNEKITKEFKVIYTIKDFGEVLYTRREDQLSFIMTNGVPFLNLEDFLSNFDIINEELVNFGKCGIIINFFKNVYTPTQSRTKLILKYENKKLIEKFITDGLYIGILHGYIDDKNDFIYIIPNTSSTAQFLQLKFSIGLPINENNIFYEYYCKECDDKYKLGEYINLVIKKCDKINNINEILNIAKTLNTGIYFDIFSKWIKNKDLNSTDEDLSINEENGFFKSRNLNIFIEEFWKLLLININTKIIKGVNCIKSAPTIFIGPIKSDNIKAYYNQEFHYIVYGNKYIDDDIINVELNKCKTSTEVFIEFNTNKYLQNLFSPVITTTLLHEIGHSIQKTSHTTASHGLTKITVNDSKLLVFDDMCLEIYKVLLNDGLLLTFLNTV